MSESNESIIAAKSLRKSFGRGAGRVHVLRGLDLAVRRGGLLAVMGPSGCGKSTLLHVLGLVTPADEGDLVIDGEPVGRSDRQRHRLRRDVFGFVFQRFNLLGQLSAADNVATSMRVRGRKLDGRIGELFAAMGVAEVAGRKPSQMSMGQQQRVAIVRALAHQPAILLADEPTGNLDSDNTAALLELLRGINRQHGQTIVMITHSAEVAAAADRTVRMTDGRIVQST
ncbi:MAG: ABC transporter ATP-binding protein [Planctomycetota bacterium]|jgi:putative ABC transport system ATP-binding protein